MWGVEEFGEDDYLFAQYDMLAVEDDILRCLIRIRNTEDWIRGVGHPVKPNDKHVYFPVYY